MHAQAIWFRSRAGRNHASATSAGEAWAGLQLIADSLVSARSVRGGGRKRSGDESLSGARFDERASMSNNPALALFRLLPATDQADRLRRLHANGWSVRARSELTGLHEQAIATALGNQDSASSSVSKSGT
jgi:hypothetical protein